jgi:hypothetical protein
MVSDFVGMVGISLPYFAATLLLPLVAFRTLPRMDSIPGAGKVLAWAVCAISMAVLIINLSWISCVIVSDVLSRTIIAPVAYAVAAVGVASLALAIVALVWSRLPRKAAAAQFALWAYQMVFFALCVATNVNIIHAGLWVSLAASGMLAIGSAIDWFQCRPGAKVVNTADEANLFCHLRLSQHLWGPGGAEAPIRRLAFPGYRLPDTEAVR